MKKTALILSITVILFSCKKSENPHFAGANCGSCHTQEQAEWTSSVNLHAASVSDVLTNVDHNKSELLNDDCIKCHSMFQYPMGISHFVTPVDTIGSPAGQWTALNTNDWKATKCEVCHNPVLNTTNKLAKYGSILDGQFSAGYTDISSLPDAYQMVIALITGDTIRYYYSDQTSASVQATKLCNSCHDPADRGSDPAATFNGISMGPQGGDSRAFVAYNHLGFGCTDCHKVHTFEPVDPHTTTACINCHNIQRTGKVHLNHI